MVFSKADFTHCPYFGETQPVAVGAAVVVRAEVVVAAVVEVLNVVALEVEEVLKAVVFEVVAGREVVEPVDPPAEQPTRLPAIATSSYQKVFVAEPYDSQPKYTPEIFGTNLLLVHPFAFGLEIPGPTFRPGTAAPLIHVSMVPSVPRWYSRHCHEPAGRLAEVAIPCGERSGRVASLSCRFHIMISDMPPNRRCWFTPSAASGITTKVTCSEVRALAACLVEVVSRVWSLTSDIEQLLYLHPYSDIYIAAWDFRRSKEGMATVSSSTGHFDRIASAVCFRRVERDCTTLVAVRSVGCPGRLIPTAFKVVRYLGKRKG